MRLTEEQYAELQAKRVKAGNTLVMYFSAAPQQKRPKYGNKKTIANDKVFASGHEARRYTELELMEKAGEIRNLQRQVPFDIVIAGHHICTYIADAVYELDTSKHGPDVGWCRVVEDTKSPPTRKKPEYVLKRKLMAAVHGIEIREVL